MKKYIFPTIAVILILICLITILPAPNPKRCAICESIPYHAPCLVNLETGEIAELFGKTETWARVTYHRARLKIKEELK